MRGHRSGNDFDGEDFDQIYQKFQSALSQLQEARHNENTVVVLSEEMPLHLAQEFQTHANSINVPVYQLENV